MAPKIGPGNIEKLYHKDFPSRQWNVIHTIGFGKGGCFAVIGTKDAFYEASVDKIAGYQRQQAKRKCNHGMLNLMWMLSVNVFYVCKCNSFQVNSTK